jgi:zinc protease
MRRLKFACTALICICSVLITWGLAAFPGNAATASRPMAQEFQLANGLRFILLEDPQSTATNFAIWYRVGSSDDPTGKSGLAHYLEHLMFKGTEKFPDSSYSNIVTADGAIYNAYTNHDYTVYHVRSPKSLLGKILELEADRMRGLKLDENLIRTERLVIQEERRLRVEGNPESELIEDIQALQFRGHPYGVEVAGRMAEIEKLTVDDVKAFYDLHYHPQNAVVIVVGNLQIEELKDLAETYFDSIPRGPSLHPQTSLALPPVPLGSQLEKTSDAAQFNVMLKSFAVPGFNTPLTEDAFALDLLAKILTDGAEGRLVKSLVFDRQLVLDVDAYYDGDQQLAGQFMLRCIFSNAASKAEIERFFNEELMRIADTGVSQSEIDAALQTLRTEQIYQWDSQSELAKAFGNKALLNWKSDDIFSLSGWETIGPEDVKSVARRFLNPTTAVTGVLATTNPVSAENAQ